ncbi:hypothetical protein B0T22DRAFT_445325 [Podospora appendiculata]|uniref:Nephrocystin 3-like N-terminal domain-containing protein n=1 Tax=Podospora appendiculata TaxID=314037 RepID=A0AAE1C7M7_9PEZI|nr:hypothetical protein B0T22DRAFT_445325 [Podospora appendiculata]
MYRRKAAIGLPSENTCDWLLRYATFRSWLDRTSIEEFQGFLCIKGKPGAGKSTILKTISTKVASEGKERGFSVATFFFNAKGTELERNRLGMLRSLAYQVVRIDESYQAKLSAIYQERIHQLPSGSKIEMEWQVPELEEFLASVFRAGTASRIMVFVDALDECAESKLATTELPPNEEWVELKKIIIDKSDGVFLWVVLVVDSLLKHWEAGKSTVFLRNHLEKVPNNLEELYTNILSSAHEDPPTTVKIFQWAVFALQPLRLREWHHILAFIRPEGPPCSLAQWRDLEDYTENDDQLERRIRSISKGLLEVVSGPDNPMLPGAEYASDIHSINGCAGSRDPHQGETRTVQVVHESVRQFFVEGKGFAVIEQDHEHNAGDGHLMIVETCLNYIKIKELDAYIQALDEAFGTVLHQQFVERHQRLRREARRSSSVQSFDSAGSGSIERRPSLQRLRAPFSLETGDMNPTDPSNYILSDFLRQGVPKEDLSSHHSMSESSDRQSHCSVNTWDTAETHVLEDFPALLHYSINMVFTHAKLAGSHGSTDSELIQVAQRDRAVWKRFQLLWNDYPTDEEFFAYCAQQGPLSWLDCIFDIGGTAYSVFEHATHHDIDAARSTIGFLDIRKNQHPSRTLLHQILLDYTPSGPTISGPGEPRSISFSMSTRWDAVLVLKKLLELGVDVSPQALATCKVAQEVYFHPPVDLELLKLLERRGVTLETSSSDNPWTVETLYVYLVEYLKVAGDATPADREFVVQTAINHGADINFAPENSQHETLLHFAATKLITGSYQSLESLLAMLVAKGAAIPPRILRSVAPAS